MDESEKVKNKILSYEEKVKENKKNISRLKNNLTIDEKALKDLIVKINKYEANLNALVNLENQYEGYNKSVKNLMQHLDSGKIQKVNGNCFVLGDIIKVDKKYETAIEIAIGAAISNIITEEENSAKVLINYLKANNLGRATFLPMTIVKGKILDINKTVKDITGYIAIASELINYDFKFKGIIEYILGKTIICNTMDNALVIAKNTGYKFKIVTLDGEVVNPGGALTGGSIYSKSVNIIGRKREIEELKVNVEEANKEILVLNERVKSLNDNIKTLDEANLNLRDEIHFENIEITKIEEQN
jgi:chromosome segregation protein